MNLHSVTPIIPEDIMFAAREWYTRYPLETHNMPLRWNRSSGALEWYQFTHWNPIAAELVPEWTNLGRARLRNGGTTGLASGPLVSFNPDTLQIV